MIKASGFGVGLTAGVLVTLCTNSSRADMALHAGMKVTSGFRAAIGTYKLADSGDEAGVVQISGSGFTVDFRGAKLIGPGGAGIGIKVSGARNVTIRNADVTGFTWGVVLERCVNVRLIHCKSSWNADLKPGTVIDESGTSPEDNHGGGFVLRDCNNCGVQKCVAQHQWDGIDVVRSNDNIIEDGDFSYNGNWGVHLWTSCRNTFRRNSAIWCTTGSGLLYQSLGGWQTYDSQAVGIDHNSNDNTIEGNDLRFGGDGIFIRANEGGQTPGHPVPVKNGSNRNRLINNDCSFSPNNAIEVDFVEDTVISGNNCSNSNYGLWLGYTVRSVCRGNTCVNDSTHAVEIENGQSGLFESNTFGWDKQRLNGELVLLRQNGHDPTPSGPYTIKNNLFYGSGVGVRLVKTPAEFVGNFLYNCTNGIEAIPTQLASSDSGLAPPDNGTETESWMNTDPPRLVNLGPSAFPRPGKSGTLLLDRVVVDGPPPVMELGGAPLWVQAVANGSVRFHVPDDFWEEPGPDSDRVYVLSPGSKYPIYNVKLAWPAAMPRITAVSPNPAHIGDSISVTGRNLIGGHFLLNGTQADVVSASGDTTVLKGPDHILTPTHYNLVWEHGTGEERVATWPVVVTVDVPADRMPHIVTAVFSPTSVKVGELLTAIITIRNNLPVPAALTTNPAPPFTYDEKQAWYEMGYGETAGALNLRVSTDFFVGGHHPGSWPWMFGFGKPELKPGETTTIECRVRLQTVGEHVFRIGLVAGGSRFIDDNAYQTRITVVP